LILLPIAPVHEGRLNDEKAEDEKSIGIPQQTAHATEQRGESKCSQTRLSLAFALKSNEDPRADCENQPKQGWQILPLINWA
jgi:hypothetical protein